MKTLIQTLFNWIASRLRERWHLSLEYLALRHQLEVLKRSAKRPQFSSADRGLWLLLSNVWFKWPQAVEIMQVDTVKRWRRQGLRHHFSWRRGRKRPGRPPIASDTRELIREMSRDNRLWGAPRIHGELLKLGIKASRTTVAKYMDRRAGPPSPTWRTFWRMHAPDLPVSEVYAELSGRLLAVPKRVSLALWAALLRLVPSGLQWRLGHPAMPLNQICYSAFKPVVRPQSVVDRVRAFGRSPPDFGSSSIDPLLPLYPPIEMGMADMRLESSATPGWIAPANKTTVSPVVSKVKMHDTAQQVAA